MIRVRKSQDRGAFDQGWLNTHHTFSFGHYQVPEHMGFRALRVINEDRVQPGAGFGEHGHNDMEIISYVVDGALEHRDSMGNGSVLRPGMFQRMSAGAGIRHSEFNHSPVEPLHFYQIWVLPEDRGIEPSYEELRLDDQELRNQLRLVASKDGRNQALAVQQDADIYLGRVSKGQTLEYSIRSGRHAWVQVVRGDVILNGIAMSASDGAAISNESAIRTEADSDAEIMLFDLS